MKLRASCLVIAGVAMAPFSALAEAEVDKHKAACSSFGFEGTTNAPFIVVQVHDSNVNVDYFFESFPVKNGAFNRTVKFEKQTEGKSLEYWVWGSPTADPNDYDGEPQFMKEGPCGGLTSHAKKCVTRVNQSWGNVMKAMAARNTQCLSDAAKGKVMFADCGNSWLDGSPVDRARTKTIDIFASDDCEIPPDFATTYNSTSVNDSATTAAINMFVAVFGLGPTIADKDAAPEAAKCQLAASKSLERVIAAYVKSFNKAKKAGIFGKSNWEPSAAMSDGELVETIDALVRREDSALYPAFVKTRKSLDAACTDSLVDPYFACSGATTIYELEGCINAAAFERACDAAAQADDLALPCNAP